MRGHRGLLTSPGLWFALALTASAAYGVEKWRRGASRTATRAERARMSALVTCVLGRDGHAMAREVARSRTRLRALAMQTSLDPAPSWLDRCVALAEALAREGARVDLTSAPTRAATHIAAPARELALALRRVGLVWQVRAGDPQTDLEHLATLLARTSAEVDLADVADPADPGKGPRAPDPAPPVPFLSIDLAGARPLPLGTPARFLVGAPLPTLSRVSLQAHRASVEVIGNDDARAWRVRAHDVIRLLGEDGAADGLAPLHIDGADGPLGHGRMATPPPGVALSGVSLDATYWGEALWVGHAIRGAAPAIVRMPTRRGEPVTAARLGVESAVDPASESEVAVGSDASGVYAAHTVRDGDDFTVSAVRAGRGARAAVLPVRLDPAAWRLTGRHPGLSMCATRGGVRLVASSRGRWIVGAFRAGALEVATEVTRDRSYFDEIATVRCSPEGALIYGRDRPRASPTLWCPAEGECVALPSWSPAEPAALPDWSVTDLRGERRTMPEWPMRFARTRRGGFIAARAAGTLVAVARSAPAGSAWTPERVVFDAAARTPGERVEDVEVYADDERALLVITTQSETHLAVSYDDGARWQRP